MTDLIGKQVGNYRFLRRLGHGGFGDVYLGQHIHLQRQAAIKVLHAYLTEWAEEAFRVEAQRLVDLEHPAIVRIFDFGIEAGMSYLVMEYAPNGSLRERHPPGSRLPLDIIVRYVKHLADALQYVHDRRLIHRDIKPANVLLGAKQNLLLSDVGLAIVAHSLDSFSLQQIAGTPAYMAPEQAQGMAIPASDQYALGIMVYEWLCGQLPFTSTNRDGKVMQRELEEQHRFVPPPPLREKIPTIAPLVETVVLTALAKEPLGRFASIQAFANALEQASQLEQHSSSASQMPTPSLSQPALSQDLDPAPSRSSAPTDPFIPTRQSSLPTQAIAQPRQLPQPTVTDHIPIISVVSASSRKKPGIRTLLLIGLALLIVIGSIGFYNLTRIDPIATPSATPLGKPTASLTAKLTTPPTATPTITPTTPPTATPTITPTTPPTATPPISSGKVILGNSGDPNAVNLDLGTASNTILTGTSSGDIELIKPGDLPGATQCILNKVSNSQLINLGKGDFNQITSRSLQGLSYSSSSLYCGNDLSNQLTPGDIFAVHTNGGNYAKVQIISYDPNFIIQIQWATYTPGQ